MNTKTFISTAVGIALLAGAAVASPGEDERHEYYERRGPLPFEVLDLNGDGTVSAEEHAQVRAERMRLRAEQGYPMRNAPSAPAFEQLDRDGSGAIDREELSNWQAQRMPQPQGMGMGKGRCGRW